MGNYLLIKDNKIINVIVAEDIETAKVFAGNLEVMESNSGTPWIDWTRSGDTWVAPETI